jgi:hypothetical protein
MKNENLFSVSRFKNRNGVFSFRVDECLPYPDGHHVSPALREWVRKAMADKTAWLADFKKSEPTVPAEDMRCAGEESALRTAACFSATTAQQSFFNSLPGN